MDTKMMKIGQIIIRNNAVLVNAAVTIVLIFITNACTGIDSNFEQSNKEEVKSVRLVLDANLLDTYEDKPTRSSSDWNDGDKVYIFFSDEKDTSAGEAIYDAEEQIWTMYYRGTLPNDNKSICRIYFFENATDGPEETIELNQYSVIYSDEECEYGVIDNNLMLHATLTPSYGRIKFKGSYKQSFELQNVAYCTSFSKKEGVLSFDDSPICLNVDENGSTPYVYCKFANNVRSLYLYKEGVKSFQMTCGESVLAAGKSGYITLPSDSNDNGWESLLPTLPKIQTGNVYDFKYYKSLSSRYFKATVSGEILSLGNCDKIFEYGHICSLNPDPTFDNGTKYKHNPTSELGQFESYLSDLKENTTYYVRTYARNEIGYNFGNVLEFTTGYGDIDIVTWHINVSYETASWWSDICAGGHEVLEAGYYYNDTGFPSDSYNIEKAATLYKETITSSRDYRFECIFEGLHPDTKYYAKAYVITESGTYVHDEIVTFTTDARDLNVDIEDYESDKEW